MKGLNQSCLVSEAPQKCKTILLINAGLTFDIDA